MYATGKASFNKLAKWLNHSPSIIYRWITQAMKNTPEPGIHGDISAMPFDEWRKNPLILGVWGALKMSC